MKRVTIEAPFPAAVRVCPGHPLLADERIVVAGCQLATTTSLEKCLCCLALAAAFPFCAWVATRRGLLRLRPGPVARLAQDVGHGYRTFGTTRWC